MEKVVTLALMRYRLRKLHKHQNNLDKKFKEDFDESIFNSLPVPPTTSVKKARGGRRKKRKSRKKRSKKSRKIHNTRRNGSGPEIKFAEIKPDLSSRFSKVTPVDTSGTPIKKENDDTQPINLPVQTTPPSTPREDILDATSPLHKPSTKKSLPRPYGGMRKRRRTRRKR